LRGELTSADDTLRSWVPNFEPTKNKITTVVERARALGYEPLLAEALLRLGRVETKLERPKRAQAALEEAVKLARGSAHDALLYDAIVDLVEVVGVEQGLLPEAETWIGLAVAESKRQPADARRLARLELATARVRFRAKAWDDALTRGGRALGLREKAFGERSREAAEVRLVRAAIHRAKGDLPAARRDAEAAADVAEHDPILKSGIGRGPYRLGLAETLLASGELELALRELEQADEELSQFGRATSVQLAVADALARAYRAKGEADKATAAADKALAGFLEERDGKLAFHDPTGAARSSGAIDIAERIKGRVEKRDDPNAISDANAKAAAQAAEGNEAAALGELDLVLARAVENPALVAASQGAIRYNLALLSLRKGDLASASSHVAESLSAIAREVGDDSLRYGVALALEARVLERQGSDKAPARAEAAQKLIALRR
jgi:tetratricopeptide (TPR) repeat protein